MRRPPLPFTVLAEHREGISGTVYNPRFEAGGWPLSVEGAAAGGGGVEAAEADASVQTLRTPVLERIATPGAHVRWQGEIYRIARRSESPDRGYFTFLLDRAR